MLLCVVQVSELVDIYIWIVVEERPKFLAGGICVRARSLFWIRGHNRLFKPIEGQKEDELKTQRPERR
jgi:hypothetical protein